MATVGDIIQSIRDLRCANPEQTIWDQLTPVVDVSKQTAAELAAGVTPTNYGYPPGDVRRYGALGDNSHDDTTAISNALSSNVYVYFPSGTYKNTAQISVSVSHLYIQATGATISAAFNDDNTSKSALIINGTSTAARIEIDGLSLTYAGSAANETLFGLRIGNTTQPEVVELRNVKVDGFRYYGAEIGALRQVHTNCRYINNYHAGCSPYGGTFSLVQCEATNNGDGSTNNTGYGVVCSGTDGRIVGGRFADNDRYGIDGRYSDNLVVDGAYVYNSGYVGIYAVNEDATKDEKNTKVVNCTVDMNSRASSLHGVWVGSFGSSGTVSPGEILVLGNTVKNSISKGILVGGAGSFPPKLVNVSDNQLSTITGFAIDIPGGSAYKSVIVARNQCQDTSEIQVSAGDSAQIVDNQFTYSGSPSRLIYCNAGKALIRGNLANGTASGATMIELGGSCTSYEINGNLMGSYLRGSTTYDPPNLAGGAKQQTTVTCSGAVVGDPATVGFSLSDSAIRWTATTTAANTVTVTQENVSGGAIDLGSGTLKVYVTKEA